jgi:quercetin dioxygenase-like cupin family protein
MEIQRWHEEPVETLTPLIGRQMIHTETMTLARILLGRGAVVPSHAHENEQIATVLEGRVRFDVDGDVFEVGSGQSVSLAANVPHGVEALEDSVVLDVFSPPRGDWIRGEDAYLRSGQA